MKRIGMITMGLVMILGAGCRHGDVEYVDFISGNQGVAAFVATHEQTDNVMEVAPWDRYQEDIQAEQPNYAPSSTTATSTDIISVVRNIIDMSMCKNIHQVAGTYYSIDTYGDKIQLSGKVFYPEKGDIKNVILVSHFTIGADFEAPSRTFSIEGMLAALGYLVIIPDYIGYGVTADRVHPYLQADLTAKNVIDMALAVAPWMKDRGIQVKDSSIILLGYSQGGATTLHVQRLMETSMDYMDREGNPIFHIKKNYCGSGPYDVAQTYDYAVKLDKTGIPCAVPMIIQGMSEGMTPGLDMAYFFKEPLLSNYKEWLNSKKYTVKQINLLLNVTSLSEILTEEGRDKSKEETQRLYRQLAKNSVSEYYVPQSPMFMFHSMDDKTVPFINSQLMQVRFHEYGFTDIEYDFGHYGEHTPGMLKFLIKCMRDL